VSEEIDVPMWNTFNFNVLGTPRPKGSWKPIQSKTTGRIILLPAKNDRDWQKQVADTIRARLAHLTRNRPGFEHLYRPPLTSKAVTISLVFWMARPKAHYRHGKLGHPIKDKYFHATPTVRPDLDKLVRSVLDAMTGLIYQDDSQVIKITTEKRYITEVAGFIEPSDEGITCDVAWLGISDPLGQLVDEVEKAEEKK
jgi:Holliday junction resolvase RusA-like endonuclease